MALDYSGVWRRPQGGQEGVARASGHAFNAMDYPRRLAPNG